MSSEATPFSKYLSVLLQQRGALARLSERSEISGPFISRVAKGEVLPSVEVLNKLLTGLVLPADRDYLALEYALLHVPAGTPNVRVVLNDEGSTPRDRLRRACETLDPSTREALAEVLEAVQRSPELGARAIQALGALVGHASSAAQKHTLALAAEPKSTPGV